MPRVFQAWAGLRLFLVIVLLSQCVQPQPSTCHHAFSYGLRSRCTAAANVTHITDAVKDYLGCTQNGNATQVAELDVLVSATVQLPEALLSRFESETGWAARVTPWEQLASGAESAWLQRLSQSYDAWILDSELLAGLAHASALAAPWLLLDPATFVEIQTASQPQVRRYGTTYRYLTAGLPVGTNTLVLYGNPMALRRLYGDENMRRRLGLGLLSASAATGGGATGSSNGGSSSSSSALPPDDRDSAVQLPPVWSWEQLVDAVAAVNGTDFDGDGVVEYGICLEVSPGCLSPALIQAIAATYLQTHGASDGVLINPSSMLWRLGSAGFRSALWTLQRLLSYSAPPSANSAPPSCRRLSAAFAEGGCAFAIHSLSHLKAAYVWPGRDSAVVGGTRVMQLPGSTRVENGAWGVMEDCTASSCPYASPLYVDAAPGYGTGWLNGWWSVSSGGGGGGPDPAAAGVNVAPLVYGIPVGGINTATPAASRAAAASFLAFLASAEAQSVLAADMQSGISSFRRLGSHTQAATKTVASPPPPPPPPPSSSPLSALQLDDLDALGARLWGHPNTAPTLRVPGAETLWPHFDAAVAYLSPYSSQSLPYAPPANRPYADDAPPEPPTLAVAAAQDLLRRELPAALDAALPSAAERRAEVQAAVAYQPRVLTQRAGPPPPAPGSRIGLIVGLTVGLGGGAALLLSTLAMRSRRTLRRLRGASSNGGDSTHRRSTATYVVLDIQGLSEPGIPDAVRDHALRICHDVVKQLARRYDGALVPLPQHEMPTAPPPVAGGLRDGGGRLLTPSAALQAALKSQLAASEVVDQQDPAAAAGTWSAKGVGLSSGGDGGGGVYDGGEESGAGARMRSAYWVYDSSYFSMTSRDLDAAPPPRLSIGSSLRPVDERLPPAAAYGAAAAAAASPMLNIFPIDRDRAAEAPAPVSLPLRPPFGALVVQTCGGTTLTTESSGRLSPLTSARAAAHAGGTVFQLTSACPLSRSGPSSHVELEVEGARQGGQEGAAAATGVGITEGRGAPPYAASGGGVVGGGASGTCAHYGTVSRRRLQDIAMNATGGSPDATLDSVALTNGAAAAAAAAASAAATGGVANGGTTRALLAGSGVSAGGAGAGGGDNSSGGGGGGGGRTSGASQGLWIARHANLPTAACHRTSLQLHHATTANASIFMGQSRPSGGKEPLSVGHLSEMLLPLRPAACTAAGVVSTPPAPQGSLSVMQSSPFTVFRTSSGEMLRPSSELDGAAPGMGSPGLGGPALSALPTLPEGGVAEGAGAENTAAAAPAGSQPLAGAASRCGPRGFTMSTPATPLLGGLGRQHVLSPLLRMRPVPYTPLIGAAPTMWPPPSVPPPAAPSASTPLPASRGGGALAAAIATAKAAAGAATAPPTPLRTRLALVFSTVHDAVCFCVHMQAMLTNCRWSPEVLELPGCQPIAVRPRSMAAEAQQPAGAAGGPAGGTSGPAARGDAATAGAAGAAAGNGCGAESGGGGMAVASVQSSFILSQSPSPFSPSGAVDRMKSLISGGVKGRSGRVFRPLPVSPRLAAQGTSSLSGAASGVTSGVAGAGPDCSGLSGSRFAAASAGPASTAGGGIAGGSFATRSLMPYASAAVPGAHSGYDPWAGGAASSGGVSRSGSTTAWGAPQLSGSFGCGGGGGGPAAVPGSAASALIALHGGGGGPSSGSHAPPRSPLGRMSRGYCGTGIPAHGSPLLGLPAVIAGSASLPLPKLPAAAHVGGEAAARPALRTAAAAAAAPRFGWPFAVRRLASAAQDLTAAAAAMSSGGHGGGHGGQLSDCVDVHNVGVVTFPDGDGAAAAVEGLGSPGSCNGELDGGLPVYPDRETADIMIGGVDSEADCDVAPKPLSALQAALSSVAVAAGPDPSPPSLAPMGFHTVYGIEGLSAATSGAASHAAAADSDLPPGELRPGPRRRRGSYRPVTVTQLPLLHLHSAASMSLQGSMAAEVQLLPVSSLLQQQQQPNTAPLDSSSVVGSAATLVIGGLENRPQITLATPASLPLAVGPDFDTPASFSLAGMAAAANGGGGSCEWPRGAGPSGDPGELSLRLAAGLRAEPTLEMPALAARRRPSSASASASPMPLPEDVYRAWVAPPLPFSGGPVAEGAEDGHNMTNNVTVTGSSNIITREDSERAGAAAAAAAAVAAVAAAASSGGRPDGTRPVATASLASLGVCGDSGGGGWRPRGLPHLQPDRGLTTTAAANTARLAYNMAPEAASVAAVAGVAASSPLAPLQLPLLAVSRMYQAGSPLLSPASRLQLQTQMSAAAASGSGVVDGGGGVSGGRHLVQQPQPVSASPYNAQPGSGAAAAAWAGAAAAAALPPQPPLLYDRAHASMPLTKLQLDEHEITPQYSAVTSDLVRLKLLQLSGVVQAAAYENTTAVAAAAAAASGGRSPGSGGDGGAADVGAGAAGAHAAPGAAPPLRPAVRSFGEQVHVTFESLPGVARNNPEAGINVIFRGPRVMCGISTWQYGDEDGGADNCGGRRSGADGVDGMVEGVEDELYDLDELSPLAADVGGDVLLPSSPPPPPRVGGAADAPSSLSDHTAPHFGVPLALAVAMATAPGGMSGGPGGGDALGDTDGKAADGEGGDERPSYATRSNPLFNVTTGGVRYERSPHAAAGAAAAVAPAGVGITATSAGLEDAQLVDAPAAAAAASVCGGGTVTLIEAGGALEYGVGVAAEPSVRGGTAACRSRGALLSPEARKQWRRRRMPAPLRRALAICESGQGGFVLLDGATYSASAQEALQAQCMILHMGEYLLAGVQPSLDLYLALDFAHLARLAHLQPLACAEQLSLGLPSAPVNCASICFCLVGGMQTLLAWNSEVAKAALGVLRDAVLPALLHHGGYLVEDADGLLLTAFSSSRSALAWALECQEEVKHLDWPEALLGHALGEAVYVDDEPGADAGEGEEEGHQGQGGQGGGGGGGGLEGPADGLGGGGGGGGVGGCGTRRHLVFRGLRLKSGLDCGDVLARVHATTGRMTYRGRVMNRAARIAGMATAGQVLCSRGLWDSSGLAVAPDLCHEALAVGESMGEVQLKGLSAKMEVINCIRILRSEMAPLYQEAVCMGEELLAGYQAHSHFGDGALAASPNGAALLNASPAAGGNSDGVAPHPFLGAAFGPAPVLMQAVPLLSDSDSDSMGGGMVAGVVESRTENAASLTAAGVSDGAQLTSSGAAGASANGAGGDLPLAGAASEAAAEWKAPRAADASSPLAGAPAAALDPDAAVGRASVVSRASATTVPADVQQLSTPSKAPLASVPATGATTSASLAAALAAARIRRAGQLRMNRYLHSGGMALDRAAVGGGHGSSSAVHSALMLAEEDGDDIEDRLVAACGYSSDGGGDGSGDGGGSGSDGSVGGVAALHGMLRRRRPAGQPGATSTAAAAAPAMTAAGSVAAAGTAKGHLATNFKKALRAVKRSLLDESGGGGGGGGGDGSASDGSASERDGAQCPSGLGGLGPGGGGGGGPVARLPRSQPRRQGELLKSTPLGAAAAAAGGGGGRILNRLRSLAANRGRGRGDGAAGGFDELEELGESRFRPMGSANSEFFPSRSGSPMLLGARARLRGGAERLAAGERDGSGTGSGGASPLQGGSLATGAGGGVDRAATPSFSRMSGGGPATIVSRGRGGGGGGQLGHTSSRLGGGSLVAEMSLASMTMRRHIPVSQLLGPGVVGGSVSGGGGSNRSFWRGGLTVDVNNLEGNTSAVTSSVTSPSAAPPISPSSATLPSQSLTAAAAPLSSLSRTPSVKRTASYRKGPQPFGTDGMAYGILEDDGEEEGEVRDAPKSAKAGDKDGAGSHAAADADGWDPEPGRSSSRTRRTSLSARGGSGVLAGTAGPSLPSRLASFTSSFLQRARSRRLPAGSQLPSGEAAGRPVNGGSEREAAAGREASRPTSGALSGSEGAAGDSGNASAAAAATLQASAGSVNTGEPAAAAVVMAVTPLRPVGRLLSRIESLRRKPALEAATSATTVAGGAGGASVAAPASAQVDKGRDREREPSESPASLMTRSETGEAPPAATAAALWTRGLPPLARSATGLGFTPVTKAPPDLEERPRSSGQQGLPAAPLLSPASGSGTASGAALARGGSLGASTSSPAVTAAASALQSAVSRRNIHGATTPAAGAGPLLDARGTAAGGSGMHGSGGSGRTQGGLAASGSIPSAVAAIGGRGSGGGAAPPAVPPAGDASVGASGGAWMGLFSSIHNFLGLSPQGTSGAGGATCPNSPRASVNMQPSSTILGGGGGGGNSSVTACRAGRRRSNLYHHTDDSTADGGGGGGGTVSAATTRSRRRSVIEVSGNVLILNAGASYAVGGWPLAGESESNYCYAGGSTMLADASYGGGGAAAVADGEIMYGGAFDVEDLLDHRGFSGHPPAVGGTLASVSALVSAAAAAAPAASGDVPASPDSPRRRPSLRRQSTLAGSAGGGGAGGAKAVFRTEAGDRASAHYSRSFRAGGGSGCTSPTTDPALLRQPAPTASAAAAVGLALRAPPSRRPSGSATAAAAGAAAFAGGPDVESIPAGSLGRLVRGISGLVSRSSGTIRDGAGGGRPSSGNPRRVSDNRRTPGIATAAAAARSSGSVSAVQTGALGLSAAATAAAAAAAAAVATRNAGRGRSRGGSFGGSYSDNDALGQLPHCPHRAGTAAATPSGGSTSGEAPMPALAAASPTSRRLVPELAKSAREFVARVTIRRSRDSAGGVACTGGLRSGIEAGSNSSVVGSTAAGTLIEGGSRAACCILDRALSPSTDPPALKLASMAQSEQALMRVGSGAGSCKPAEYLRSPPQQQPPPQQQQPQPQPQQPPQQSVGSSVQHRGRAGHGPAAEVMGAEVMGGHDVSDGLADAVGSQGEVGEAPAGYYNSAEGSCYA